MRPLFVGSCPKNPGSNDINEDRWAISKNGETLALCDGASESYNSAVWAQILADKFVLDPVINPDWLSDALANYTARHDFASMSWSQQASFGRGSFSTLLGVRHIVESNRVDILAAGDSLAVLIAGDVFISSWPYSDPENFKSRPTLFSTLSEHNSFISDSEFWDERGKHVELTQLAAPRLLCVTDALGEWLLRQVASNREGLSRLLSIATEKELINLVMEERATGGMRTDDSTLIVVSFDTVE